jgi:hypothetical protein
MDAATRGRAYEEEELSAGCEDIRVNLLFADLGCALSHASPHRIELFESVGASRLCRLDRYQTHKRRAGSGDDDLFPGQGGLNKTGKLTLSLL